MNKSGLYILIILYAAFISLGLPDQAFGVAWPDMRRFFGQPLDAGGVIIFLLAMMSAFTSFGAGWLRKRLSIAAVLIVSTFLTVVGMLGFALSPVWLVLLVAVLPYGLGAGAIDACLNDYVAKNYSSRQMNWLHACWGIGASLGPAIMTVAVTRFNWQKGYVFIAVLQMILLLFFVFTRKMWKETPVSAASAFDSSLPDKFWMPAPLLSAAFFFVYTAAEFSLSVWFYSVMVEEYRISPALAGSVVVAYWCSLMCGRFLVGIVSDRLGNRKVITGGLAVAALGVLLLFSARPFMLFCGVGLAGLGFSGIYPSMMHETPQRFSSRLASVVTGVQAAMAALGVAVLAPLVGIFISQTSLACFLPCALVMISVLALCNWQLNRIT